MKLPKCKVCNHQFNSKEIIISQWRFSTKELKCSKCNTKYTVRNSFLLFLFFFSGAYITSKLLVIKHFSPEVNLLIELLIFIITAIFISLIIPYFVKLGTPIKE
jgi:CXXC-20-CXXC protein